MDEFILIFRHQDGKKLASPEQIQIWMKQTMDWIGGIAAQNKFSGGNGLPFDDAKVVWQKHTLKKPMLWREQRPINRPF
ncbi:MAG: hypothetical protein WD824_26730 [Cyclobacteriaceae bacterium]